MAAKKETPFEFETALEDLTTIVEQMEQGGLTLEQALKNFERGITLVRNCQAALKTAEQKVQILTEQHSEASLTDYQSSNGDSQT